MGFRLPRRLRLGFARSLGRCGKFVALAGFGALLVPATHAQIVIGGHAGPAVTVDNSVLERLGPPRTLPQLFLGERGGTPSRQAATKSRPTLHKTASHRRIARHVASRHRTLSTHRVARAAPSRAKPPVRTASSLHRIIYLTPPGSRLASAKPTPMPAPRPSVSHEDMAVSAPTKPAVAALVAPARPSTPAPKEPAGSDTPTPPVAPQTATREVAPPTPVEPPSEPAVARAPIAATSIVASTAEGSRSPVAAVSAQPAAAVSTSPIVAPPVASPVPIAATTSAAPSNPSSTPPVQMAAATTAGNGATTVKFKPGATDLGGGAQPELDALASRLRGNENLRVQLISHATGSSDEAMEARRISLARAIAVRRYLIDKGIASLRIDVRALGNHAGEGPVADQVDLLVVSQ